MTKTFWLTFFVDTVDVHSKINVTKPNVLLVQSTGITITKQDSSK